MGILDFFFLQLSFWIWQFEKKKSLYGHAIQRMKRFKEVSDKDCLGFTAEPAEVVLKQLYQSQSCAICRGCRQLMAHTVSASEHPEQVKPGLIPTSEPQSSLHHQSAPHSHRNLLSLPLNTYSHFSPWCYHSFGTDLFNFLPLGKTEIDRKAGFLSELNVSVP